MKACPPPKESDIQKQILTYLRTVGAVAVRVNSGGRPWTDSRGKARYMRFNDTPGCSDIIGCYCGRFVAIEVKRPGGSKTDPERKAAQDAFLASVEKAGGLAFYASSVGDVAKHLVGVDSE